ncbi:MAG TPA: DUF1653 domain-containing protein [Lachnospiraceae bacterium]|nr:DUF1653 domain-containing protein [Lachnospiraceae bacterium]
MPQSNPLTGEVYRHFKGKMYKVMGVAVHSETGEAMVIYQGMYGDHVTYVRPYESFIEKLDKKKYEDASETYRFTFIPMNSEFSDVTDSHISEDTPTKKEESQSPMIKFLDTDDFDEKYEILCNIPRADINDVLIDNLAVTLDVVIPDGSIEQRFAELKTCVRTRKKYESLRLR